MNYKPLSSLPVDLTQLQTVSSSYRPYYTEKNALAVKGVFDTYLASPKPLLIPLQGGVTIRTLYSQVTYGVKWLAERHADRAKYTGLRQSIRIKQTDRGILIAPKTSSATPITSTAVSTLDTNPKSWMERFVDWVTAAQAGDMFDSIVYFGGIVTITNEDEQALIKLGAQLGLELDINKELGKFRAMR